MDSPHAPPAWSASWRSPASSWFWNAYDDRGLVEAFSVPPDFAQKGITGKVVAAEVLDHVNLLQTQTHTARPVASFRNNWGDDIKVEIPDTGISIGELSRILHDKLGHATRIEGDVVRTEGGLLVSARIRDEPAMRASGPESDLDKLVQQVTEQAYSATQPYRYAAYLFEHDRMREAVTAFRALAERGPADERPWGWVGVGNNSLELDGFEIAFDGGLYSLIPIRA
jgi:hypothetical protein